jgi:hypothetical protein
MVAEHRARYRAWIQQTGHSCLRRSTDLEFNAQGVIEQFTRIFLLDFAG